MYRSPCHAPSRTPLILLVAWYGVFGCAGAEFEARKSAPADGGSENLEGGAAGSDSGGAATTDGGSAGERGSSNTEQCGNARRSPETHEVDLCVPAGSFTMGSSSANLGTGHYSHAPPHQVILSAFLIDAFEVTVARYRRCVRAGDCAIPSTGTGCTYTTSPGPAEDLPISCLTFEQAIKFCAWDGNRRLPSEAEWERTAAGPDANRFPWGNEYECGNAVLLPSSEVCSKSYSGPVAVDSLASGVSPEGAYHMAGNVSEWVSDWAANYPSESEKDPVGPSSGKYRITRGGSYRALIGDGQTFARSIVASTSANPAGVRCARSVTRGD